MATLTEVSAISRKAIKFGAVGLVVLMLIPGAIALAKKYWAQTHPAPPPAPTVKYGKLPEIVFPSKDTDVTPEYKLETIQGGLPSLVSVAKVYVVGVNKARLVSLDKLRQQAGVLGFSNDLIPLDEQTYKFVHPSLPAEIVFNIITGTVAYRWDWTTEPKIYSSHEVPQTAEAIASSRSLLTRMGLLTSELASGDPKVLYLVASGSAITPIDTPYQANFTRVDFFRPNKDTMPVVTGGGDTSPVSVLFSGVRDPNTGAQRVAQLSYQFSPTLDNDFATYPLRPISQAWDELLQGQGYIARKAGPKVIVRLAYLAYYESSDPQGFLQPVYVFEGDGAFKAYVPAISHDYVNSPSPTAAPVTETPTSPIPTQ